jgi:predicted PhzF superfamily epimerase YddE/YHI9
MEKGRGIGDNAPMRLPYYQLNAFTNRPFGGNPAGVCLLDKWLPDAAMQAIATENDLAETAFVLKRPEAGVHPLRWFTPAVEIDLCGHATLATAYVFFNELSVADESLSFSTKSGILKASKRDRRVELDFPSRPAAACDLPGALTDGLRAAPREVFKARDYLAVFDSEDGVAALKPDLAVLGRLDCLGIIATAPGRDCDFVSRFFAPRAGIPEDPVTGSSHCTLVPYWSKRLGKKELHARQISKRGGELFCRDEGERVRMAGDCTVYLRGEIEVSE